MEELTGHLNEQQKAVVLAPHGPAVVFAGAGSGKTRVITSRIAYLIETGIKPWEILALTFTNKAAAEMKARAIAQCPRAKHALVTTFHSACGRWLREFCQELGFTSDFSIYDEDDSFKVLKDVIKRLGFSDKKNVPAAIRGEINWAKTFGYLPNDLVPGAGKSGGHEISAEALAVYKDYQEALALANAMDFGDLLLYVHLLLAKNERVRTLLQSKYRCVLVDEFQDTNGIQLKIVRELVRYHQNLLVVGDDDQSIYSWRGAVPSVILRFEDEYPQARRYFLEQNYRSTASILRTAVGLISHNVDRAPKVLFTEQEEGEKVDYIEETDNEMEAWRLVTSIQSEQLQFPLDQVAVFYRTNAQSRAIEDYLVRYRLPYRIYGSLKFYERLEIKDLLAYLRILVNPDDDVALLRVINTPSRGIGASTVSLLEAKAWDARISLYKTLENIVLKEAKAPAKLRDFYQLLVDLKTQLLQNKLSDYIGVVLDKIPYKEHLKKKFPEQFEDKLGNIVELSSALSVFEKSNPGASLSEWLQSLNLTDGAKGEGTGVTLMTLHLAKGLEFDRVYIAGIEDQLLPHMNSHNSAERIEEERRLFYVGITRARKKLTLLSARCRQTFRDVIYSTPSRFLQELPPEHVSGMGKKTSSWANEHEEYSSSQTPVQNVAIGDYVTHPTFGFGKILRIISSGEETKFLIEFEDFGKRTLGANHLSEHV